MANAPRGRSKLPSPYPIAHLGVSLPSRDMLRLTATPGFKALPASPCIHTHSKRSTNLHWFPWFPCGFRIFRASVSHTMSLCTLGKIPSPCRHSPARLHGSVEHGGTSAPQLGVLGSEPPALPGLWSLTRAATTSHRPGPSPALHADGAAFLEKAAIRGLPDFSPAPTLSKPNRNRKGPPLRAPWYSGTEVYGQGTRGPSAIGFQPSFPTAKTQNSPWTFLLLCPQPRLSLFC